MGRKTHSLGKGSDYPLPNSSKIQLNTVGKHYGQLLQKKEKEREEKRALELEKENLRVNKHYFVPNDPNTVKFALNCNLHLLELQNY